MLKYLAFRLASVLIPILPQWLVYGAAWLGAEVAFALASGPRDAVMSNLRRVLGPDVSKTAVRQTARRVFRTLAYNYVDMFLIPRIPIEELAKRVSMVNIQAFLNAHREGKGVIVVFAHLGNIDLVVQMSAVYNIPVTALVEPLTPPSLFDLVTSLRSAHGVRLVPIGPHALREALKVLRSGGVVAIAADRNLQGRGAEATFFGELALLPPGAVELAMRTGAALVPFFGLRLPGRRFELSVEPPLQLARGGHEDADIRENMQRLLSVIEGRIRKHPDQWIMFQRIWGGPRSGSVTSSDNPQTPVGVNG